jgi:hypothetical protein
MRWMFLCKLHPHALDVPLDCCKSLLLPFAFLRVWKDAVCQGLIFLQRLQESLLRVDVTAMGMIAIKVCRSHHQI